MLFLGLISGDDALTQAFGEQMKQADGWQSAFFTTPQEALEAWREAFPPLVIWDAQACPQHEAALFYRHLSQKTVRPWLILLGDLPCDVEGDAAFDFLPRPVRLGKLLARLHFYKKLLELPQDVRFSLGPWFFSPRRRALERDKDGQEIKLTDKEAALLEYLVVAEQPVPKDKLLEDVWGYGHQIDTHTLETHIYRLRRKMMAEDETLPDCFLAEHGCYHIPSTWRGK
jgi:DNA-binding response OmpR family regulator